MGRRPQDVIDVPDDQGQQYLIDYPTTVEQVFRSDSRDHSRAFEGQTVDMPEDLTGSDGDTMSHDDAFAKATSEVDDGDSQAEE